MKHIGSCPRPLVSTLCTLLAACGGTDSYVPREVGGYPPPATGAPAPYAMAEPGDEVAASSYVAAPAGQAFAPSAQLPQWNTEQYDAVVETGFRSAAEQPLSTFSVDVDTASYSNLRRFLALGQLPPPDAVRIEELLNYFSYQYAEPEGDHPIGITSELADSPFGGHRKLLRVGLLARDQRAEPEPAKNLVFLLESRARCRTKTSYPCSSRRFRS
jgi:Ca-activated chloride channel family protein